ncbi:aldehyde dehydrogenase family protein [Halorubellus sp. JP-L1]|uniref:aldehyde dehydrogenase family protein n=1 Tax=Halorubellus sp. JP-L1 TaxID=2715753 RepID=UPI00140B9C6D|nr:aldehyde dehydrogenase family protein [Halorubellus sp. JP-L1]NHN42947.1 aldehyde dehydrogenase family protein [Halorubellus sp. JP-L1]
MEHQSELSTYDLVIDGESVTAAADERFETLNPATGKPFASVARAREADVNQAVAAAKDAFDDWSSTPPQERGRLLNELADEIRAQQESLALLETRDNGKPLSHARADVETCARYFEYYAGAADKVHGDSIPLTDEYVDYTVREPLGVTAQIIPWNLPTNIFGRSVAPALATGNTAVVKPAEQTPLTAVEIGRLATEVGIPDGVLNVVPGFGAEAGAPLSAHPDIDGVSFTGSVPTGIEVGKTAIENVTNVHLELGGKSPNVVWPDADIDSAVDSTMTGIFANAGQVCSAGSRLIIHEDVKEEFLDVLTDRIEEMDVDSGEVDPDMGPLVSEEHFEKVTDYLEIGREEAGEPLVGGEALDRDGYFVEPTVFTGVDNDMRIAQEEIFGPVLSVIEFSTEEEAMDLANGVDYGLVAGIHTQNMGRAHRFARDVLAGQVYINEWFAGGEETPFGGFKESGFGREKGLAAIDSYTQVKNVCADITPK